MNFRNVVILLVVGAAIGVFFCFDLQQFLALAALKSNRETLLSYYATNRIAVVAGFMALYIIQTALMLPGAAVLSLAAGAVFGSIIGTVYAVAAATIGAAMAFLATLYLLRDMVLDRFGKRLDGINRELEERGLNYLLLMRLVPLFPFFLINLAAGLTRLPLRTFSFGTSVRNYLRGLCLCECRSQSCDN